MASTFSSKCRRHDETNETMSEVDDSEAPERDWADLPAELLCSIAKLLRFFDLFRLRSVCKDWRSAASLALPSFDHPQERITPCFVLHGVDSSSCSLYSPLEKRKYTISIPGLREATCLASYQGWLLLFQTGLVFFFCPFSGSRIDLPMLPSSENPPLVGVFSSPPTSPDCTVAVINRIDDNKVEINVIDRKASEWTKHEYNHLQTHYQAIKGAMYHGGVFYFLDDTNKVLTFSGVKQNWKMYRIVEKTETNCKTESLPFYQKDNYLSRDSELKQNMELGDDVSIVTCAAWLPEKDYGVVIKNENIVASKESSRSFRGIWVQPRFIQIPSDYTWSL